MIAVCHQARRCAPLEVPHGPVAPPMPLQPALTGESR